MRGYTRLLSICIIIFSFFFCPFARSQTSAKHLFNSHISSSRVTCFAQDGEGYLWIGTNRGLNRFDGMNYTYFLKYDDRSIISDHIFSLCCDSKSRLWIGTAHGLDLYDLNTEEFVHFQTKTINRVTAICDVDEDYLIYSDDEGLALLDKNTLKTVVSDSDETVAQAEKILVCSNGDIWVGSSVSTSVNIYSKHLEIKTSIELGPDKVIKDLDQVSSNMVCVSTDKGLFAYNLDTYTPIQLGNEIAVFTEGRKIHFMEPSPDNGYVIGIENVGLVRTEYGLRFPTLMSQNKKIHFEEDASAFVDNEADVWISDAQSGGYVMVSSNVIHENHHVDPSVSDYPIHHMGLYHDNTLWLCTDKTVFLFDVVSKTTVPLVSFNSDDDSRILFVELDSEGKFYLIMEDHSVLKYDVVDSRAKLLYQEQFNEPMLIWEDNDHNQWIQCRKELLKLNTDGTRQSFPTDQDKEYYGLSTVDDNQYVFLFVEDDGPVILRGVEYASMSDRIKDPDCVTMDSENNVWVGTFNNGLYKFSPLEDGNYDIKHFSTMNGLKESGVVSVLEDEYNNIWVASTRFISKYNKDNDTFTHIETSNFNSGQQFESQCAVATNNGTICFGGISGLFMVYPERLNSTKVDPKLKLDLVMVNEQEVGGINVFRNTQDEIDFYYSALDLANGHILSFRHKLVGRDKNWVYAAQQRSASYSSLRPGKYTFMVEVQNARGEWLGVPISYNFTIKSAPLLSPVAVIAYIILLFLVVAFVSDLYVKNRISQNELSLTKREKFLNEQLSRSKINFFTNISHELLTPLSMIYAPAKELSSRGDLSERDSKLVSMIEHSSEKMYRLAQNLLDIDRDDNTSEHLRVSMIDYCQEVQTLVDNFSILASEKGLSLTAELPFSAEVYCDVEKVEKILCNIIGNAIKYTPSGGSINVELTVDKGYAIVSVKDTGPGIPKDRVEKIFQRYTRLESGQTQGHGIGLNYSIFLARLHKGDIEVQQNIPNGSVFRIWFPCVKDAYTKEEMLSDLEFLQDRREDVSDKNLVHTDYELTMLVVDDNADLRSYIRQMFQHQFNMMAAVDGKDALEQMKTRLPDIILCDVMMPQMDGFEFTRVVKQDKDYCHIPVILLTARGNEPYRLKGVQSGADSYVTKPFEPSYLEAVVDNLLVNRKRLQRTVMGFTSGVLNDCSGPKDVQLSAEDMEFLHKTYEVLDENLEDGDFNILEIASRLSISRSTLYSKIKGLTGVSPQQYVTTYRLNKAYELLEHGDITVSDVARAVGFQSAEGFSRSFKKQFGVSPVEVRNAKEQD